MKELFIALGVKFCRKQKLELNINFSVQHFTNIHYPHTNMSSMPPTSSYDAADCTNLYPAASADSFTLAVGFLLATEKTLGFVT